MPEDHPNDPQTPLFVHAQDAAVIDALVSAGFQPQPAETRGREQRVAALFSLLDLPLVGGPVMLEGTVPRNTLLTDVTMARVLRAAERELAGRIEKAPTAPRLAVRDSAAIDALVESGWSTAGPGIEGDSSVQRASKLCSLLDAAGAAAPAQRRDSLIAATLSRVQREIDRTGARFRMASEESPACRPRSGMRLADLAAVAAVLMIGTGVLWPVFGAMREEGRERACSSNLQRSAIGFTLYAGDHAGSLPQAEASFFGGTWWDVGTAKRSHSANLYALVREGYASLTDLSCPGNPRAPIARTDPDTADWRAPEEVSFSYQLFGPGRPTWDQGSRIVVLSDRSPVIERARRGERFDPTEASRNHNGHGQNLLFSDGSVRYYLRPVLENGDNIWLPSPDGGPLDERLTGRERPADDRDAFVGP